MISKPAVAWIAMACLSLSACGDGRPKGQVVAKVGKEEVTIIDLNAALAGAQTPNAAARKAAEQQALASILQRKILAQAARKQKLDRTPEFARQERQLEENLLFRTWEDKLVKSIPAPNADEIQQFIDQHPDLYKAHKVFTIDVVRFAAPLDPALAEALRPLTTLDQARTLLTERKIAFANAASKVDALSVDPRFVDQLIKMKTNEIFVMPQASGQIILGHVTDGLSASHPRSGCDPASIRTSGCPRHEECHLCKGVRAAEVAGPVARCQPYSAGQGQVEVGFFQLRGSARICSVGAGLGPTLVSILGLPLERV